MNGEAERIEGKALEKKAARAHKSNAVDSLLTGA